MNDGDATPERQTEPHGGKAGLTLRELRFVEEYLIDLNATAAYRRAFPRAGLETARKNAARFMAREGVRAKILTFRRRVEQRIEADAVRTARELVWLAFSDLGDVLDFSGDALAMRRGRSIAPEARRAIASIKVSRRLDRVLKKNKDGKRVVKRVPVEVVSFKMHDKVRALEKLAKYLDLFPEREPLAKLLDLLPPDVAGVVKGALKQAIEQRQALPGAK